jgi:cytosine/adenosine deaminase-related metal-dependent hydrolase
MADEMALSARWIFPVASAPIEGGTVTIRGERIVDVSPRGRRAADVDLGNRALIPGLVNAHTHLDLSGLRGKVPPSPDFTGWLKKIIQHRLERTSEQMDADIQAGLAEALRYGTTSIADIAGQGSSWPQLQDAPCDSIVYRELLGLKADRAMIAWRDAQRWLDGRDENDRCRAGLSPHAPYSVNQALFRAAGLAGEPLAIHLAETKEELELLTDRRGPFVEFLKEVGAWQEESLVPSIDWLLWRSERAPSLLLAHGNFLPERTRLPANATVVYCPRTHAAFGHSPHPFQELQARGVRVALGTDSLASNPDLDLLAEAKWIHENRPDVRPDDLLRMATLDGAEALGYGAVTGSLEPGKSADMVVVPLRDEEGDAHELLFTEPGRPRRTMWRGTWRE